MIRFPQCGHLPICFPDSLRTIHCAIIIERMISHAIIASAATSPVTKLFQIESILPRQPCILEYPKTEQRRQEAALFTTWFSVSQLCLPCLFQPNAPKGGTIFII